MSKKLAAYGVFLLCCTYAVNAINKENLRKTIAHNDENAFEMMGWHWPEDKAYKEDSGNFDFELFNEHVNTALKYWFGYQTEEAKYNNDAEIALKRAEKRSRLTADVIVEPIPTTCSNVGNATYQWVLKNKCTKRYCYVKELSCNGEIQDHTYRGDIAQCSVTKMECVNMGEGVDSMVTWPADECQVNAFMCDTRRVPVVLGQIPDVNMTTCYAEARCGNRFYGFNSWDWECLTDKLYCDGQPIDSPTGVATGPNCEVRRVPCNDTDINAQCSKISEECDNNVVDGFCRNHEDRRVMCHAGESAMCRLKTINCNGRDYDASTYSGIVALCNVKSIECNGTETVIQTGTSQICRAVEMTCADGSTRPFITSLPSECSISRVGCAASATDLQNCTSWSFGCATPKCQYTETKDACGKNCRQMTWDIACSCPLDYVGNRCERRRPLNCSVELISPKPTCEDMGYLSADPVCFPYKIADTVEMAFNLSCHFDNVNITSETLGNFTYDLVTDKFAFTTVPNMVLMQRIYNFAYLTDTAGSITSKLTAEHFKSEKLVNIALPLSTLDRQYMAGGRVYSEFRIADGAKPFTFGPSNRVQHKMFIDVMDWVDTSPPKSRMSVWVILAIVGGLFVLLVICGAAVGILLWYKKKQPNKKKSKRYLK